MSSRRRLRRRLAGVAAAVAVLAAVLAGCGEDDFENQPRPPATVERSVLIDDRAVSVASNEVGAGLVNFTISNQSGKRARLALDGPTEARSDPIPAGGVGELKAELEPGTYEVLADGNPGARPGSLEVGPERRSSSNELLLP